MYFINSFYFTLSNKIYLFIGTTPELWHTIFPPKFEILHKNGTDVDKKTHILAIAITVSPAPDTSIMFFDLV